MLRRGARARRTSPPRSEVWPGPEAPATKDGVNGAQHQGVCGYAVARCTRIRLTPATSSARRCRRTARDGQMAVGARATRPDGPHPIRAKRVPRLWCVDRTDRSPCVGDVWRTDEVRSIGRVDRKGHRFARPEASSRQRETAADRAVCGRDHQRALPSSRASGEMAGDASTTGAEDGQHEQQRGSPLAC